MAEFGTKIEVRPTIWFKVTEVELRALDALAGYGFDPFMKVFKEHLGSHYMEGNEKGLASFFDAVRQNASRLLVRMEAARESVKE